MLKVSLMRYCNPWPLNFRFGVLPTELASLTQDCSGTVDVYTRRDIETHKLRAYAYVHFSVLFYHSIRYIIIRIYVYLFH